MKNGDINTSVKIIKIEKSAWRKIDELNEIPTDLLK